MAKQTLILGVVPTGVGGDDSRTGSEKINSNFNEVYAALGAPTSGASKGVIPSALPIDKGGTGATTASAARTNLGLGAAATRDVGTSEGSVLPSFPSVISDFNTLGSHNFAGFFRMEGAASSNFPTDEQNMGYAGVIQTFRSPRAHGIMIFANDTTRPRLVAYSIDATGEKKLSCKIYTSANTTVDGSGNLKAASPIIQLFAEEIKLNDESRLQDITFEKLSTGDYLIKNTSGFAQEGWYIEQPKDANGNVLVAVIYEQLENNDISVKTYKKKFDLETASIVADLEYPTDIPEGRWIDIRLQELPQPEPEVEPESIAPPDFQPTNLSEAVQSFMAGGGYVSE